MAESPRDIMTSYNDVAYICTSFQTVPYFGIGNLSNGYFIFITNADIDFKKMNMQFVNVVCHSRIKYRTSSDVTRM